MRLEQLSWMGRGRPVPPSTVDALERALGVHLPDELREFLVRMPGVEPTPGGFSFEDPVLGRQVGASIAAMLSADPADPESIAATRAGLAGQLAPALVPFATDGGGDFLVLDYRASAVPRVAYWHHERTGDAALTPLDATLAGFLARLLGPS